MPKEWLYYKMPVVRMPVDKQALYFRKYGEFSLSEDEAFEEHLKKLAMLSSMPMFKRMNGRRLKELYKTEPFKYWRP